MISFSQHLVRESCVWRQLDHVNVLPFYGLSSKTGDPSPPQSISLPGMVSPWMTNGHLRSYLDKNPQMPESELRRIVMQLFFSSLS